MTKFAVPPSTDSRFRIPAKPVQPEKHDIERIGVSVEVAAEMIGVGVRTMWTLAKEQKVRTVRIRKRVIFSVQSLREFIDGKPANADKSDIACPNQEWRTIIALARIGGLRCPSELQQLRWSDVKKDRFTVRSPKTEHHEGHAERDVPLFTELQIELKKHFVAGNEFVIQGLQGTAWSLHEAFQEIARSAGIGTIKRPFDNMRMSRSNEVFERWGEAKGTKEQSLWITICIPKSGGRRYSVVPRR